MTELTPFGATFLLVTIAMVVSLPRRWAALPLLLGTFYMPLSQGLAIGPFNLFSIRLLVLAGIIRIFLRRETIAGGFGRLDALMVVWALSATFTSLFRDDAEAALKFNFGMAFNACGVYFLLRAFCTSRQDVVRLCAMTSLLLVPVAVEMYAEHVTSYNAFSALGGLSESPQVRDGRIRAQGPLAHPILAGTVGAVALPLAIGLWSRHRRIALCGIAACLTMIATSASSGPVLSGCVGILALATWRWRERVHLMRRTVVLGVLLLSLVMQAPIYYLLARIDVAGGSTGWYRARLIESALEHIDEWWAVGTANTGHWMATGLDRAHADITNHYIHMGVTGGVALLFLFVWILVAAFQSVGRTVREAPDGTSPDIGFLTWALGSSLFAHAATFVSVSYFDQSFVMLYLTLAAIAAMASHPRVVSVPGYITLLTRAAPPGTRAHTLSGSGRLGRTTSRATGES